MTQEQLQLILNVVQSMIVDRIAIADGFDGIDERAQLKRAKNALEKAFNLPKGSL